MATQYSWPQLKLETPKLSTPNWSLSSLSSSFSSPSYATGSSLANQWSTSLADAANKSRINTTGTSLGSSLGSSAINALGSTLTNNLANNIFGDDTEAGAIMGNIFSSGSSAATSTIAQNIIKGDALTKGLGSNVTSSIAGAGAGLAANYLGQGITSALGNTRTARGIGAGISTAAGTVGGAALSGALSTTSTAAKAVSSINPYALAMNVAGSVLGGVTDPSKEYAGKYGKITQTMDTIYDVTSAAVNVIPGVGQVIGGAMALNKGLSNLFGSTDGMTKTDAILGSAFMPAPVKWINMWGSSKTGTFDNQSWQNSEKTKSFMGNAFGNLQDRFDRASAEAGKTYGTFSQRAKEEADENIEYSNRAWKKILAMADQNEYQTIRSSDMSSVNSQRYAQNIQGGLTRIGRGKLGMKILNNATNHTVGMRLLSGAALIDNKQMILSRCRDLD